VYIYTHYSVGNQLKLEIGNETAHYLTAWLESVFNNYHLPLPPPSAKLCFMVAIVFLSSYILARSNPNFNIRGVSLPHFS